MAGARVQAEQTTQSYDWQDFGPAHRTGGAADDGGIILSSILSGGSYGLRLRHGAINLGPIFNRGIPNGIGIAAIANQYSTGSAGTVSAQPFRFRIDAYRGQYGHLDRIALICAVAGMYRTSTRDGHMTKTGPQPVDAAIGISLNSARFAHKMNEITSRNRGITFLDANGDHGKAAMWYDARGEGNLIANVVSTLNPGVEILFSITGM